MTQQYFSGKNRKTGKDIGFFAKYNFGQIIIKSINGRNWKVKIENAILDRDMNFVEWEAKIINWRLWYKLFPSEKCTHWIEIEDMNNPLTIH